MKLLQVSYLKITTHRSGKRVWIQGLRLEDAGYQIGTTYSIRYDESASQVTLNLDTRGDHKVSKKRLGDRQYPLIDLANQTLSTLFAQVDRVEVVIEHARVIIRLHHFDAKRIEREQRLKSLMTRGKPLPIASMAHGAGIMDYYIHKGLEDENIRTGLIWSVEPENTYLQTSWNNNPTWSYECAVIEGRIEDVDLDMLDKPVILAAGLPCTGASLSGRAKNKLKFAEQHESAGTAFIGYLMAIRALSPAICILENVPQYANTVSMHMIREMLTDLRYTVHETVLDRELGAFEDRRRLCMVAVSEGIDFEFDLKPVRQREETLGEMLDDIPADSSLWNSCEYLDKKLARDVADNKGFKMQLVDEDSTRVGTIGRAYSKWRTTEPLVANHPHNEQLKRLLTVSELARVKTIDESLVTGMSRTRQIEMMGQSVLGAAFQALGRNIGEYLNCQYPAVKCSTAA